MAKRSKGEGGIYEEPGGTWRAIVYINGKAHKRRAATREAAEALRQQLLAQRSAGIDVGGGGQTLAAWLVTWQAAKERNLRERSQANNRRLIDGYLMPLLGTTPLNKLKADKLQATLHRVQDDIVKESGGRYTGARTVQALAQLLRASLDLARTRRLIAHNPMEGVARPSYSAAEKEPLSDVQLQAFLNKAHEHPLAALWRLYALLGLRRGEGLGVRWDDLDFDAGIIHIKQQVQEIDGKPTLGEPKYTSARTLPLPAACVESLRELRAAQMRLRLKRAKTYQDQGLVFANRDGGPLWPSNVLEAFYTLRAAAGAPPSATIHTLRHTLATLLDECGASEALKAGILGHGKRSVTQRYTHARLAAMRKVIEQVSERITRKAA